VFGLQNEREDILNSSRGDELIRSLIEHGVDRRTLLRVIGAGVGAAWLSGVPPRSTRGLAAPASVQEATPGGTLIYARDGDADSLDPHKTTTTLS
jgi:hypothetical protein